MARILLRGILRYRSLAFERRRLGEHPRSAFTQASVEMVRALWFLRHDAAHWPVALVDFLFMRFLWLLLLLLASVSSLLAFYPPAPPTIANAVKNAQASAVRAEESANAAEEAKEAAEKQREETLKKLDATSAEMIARATFLQTIATSFVAFVAFAITAAGFGATLYAFRVRESLSKLKEGEVLATVTAAKRLEIKGAVESHKLFLDTLQQQVSRALGDIETKMKAALTPGTGLIGVELGARISQRSYDDDALIVFSDRLQITSQDPEFAKFLVMFGNYWRRTKEYTRAIERIRRAIELDPSSAMAHKALGRALWNAVAEDLATPASKISASQVEFLKEAETEFGTAQSLLAAKGQHDKEIPFDLGTISRLKGEINMAMDQYRKGAQLSKALAQAEGRESDWDFAYAIACLHAESHRYQEALDQLKEVIGKTQSWSYERGRAESRDYKEWTRSDPDFAEMASDATRGPQLMALST